MPIDVFMPFQEMEKQLREIASSAPELVHLGNYGLSREGRPLYLLTITDFSTGAAEDKPAFFVQAHIHCHELSGTPAVLDFARDLIAKHSAGGILETTAFYLVPRINPDGSEKVIRSSGYIRSRWDVDESAPNTFRQEDVDGNGKILVMRVETPFGELCQDPADPRCLIPRKPDSKGPFYHTIPEGTIHNWDGRSTDLFDYEGTLVDMNRNWPSNWKSTQLGAGKYPACEPEVRQTLEFLFEHRNIFSALCFHNGWGGILRPPDGIPDEDLPPADRSKYNEITQEAEQIIGYPAYASCKFNFEGLPPIYRQGSFDDCMYFLFGMYSMTIELGTSETSAGVSTKEMLSSEARLYYEYTAPREVCAHDDAHPEYRLSVHHWKKFHHPQFGDVEIGGIDTPAFAVPDPAWQEKLYPKVDEFIMRYAARRPCVKIAETHCDEYGGNVRRVRIVLFNEGEFPTNICEQGLKVPAIKEPEVRFTPAPGCECLSRRQNFHLGHFKGWEKREFEWFVRGSGPIGTFRFLCGAGGNAETTL